MQKDNSTQHKTPNSASIKNTTNRSKELSNTLAQTHLRKTQSSNNGRKSLDEALAKSRSISNTVQNRNDSRKVDDSKRLNEIYSNLLSDDLNDYVNKSEEADEEENEKRHLNFNLDVSKIKEICENVVNHISRFGKKFSKGLLTIVAGIFTAGCTCILCYAFVLSNKTMPDLVSYYNGAHNKVESSTKNSFKKEDNSFIYDKDGNTLAKLRQNRDTDYVQYKDIPQKVIDAFISVEDRRFYDHQGVDLQSTAKAVEILVRGKLGESTGVERGGSTITQQMVKNVFLTNKKTYGRKIKEIFLALEVEKKYSKEDILEFYINNVYFYNNCYGIASAAQSYFSKDLNELSLAEIATLCAIPNSPYYYNPVSNYEHNKERRNLILKRMKDQGYITKEEYRISKKSNTTVVQNQKDFYNYEVSYAIDCAVEYLMQQDDFKFQYSFSTARDYKEYRKRYLEEYDLMRKELFTGGYKIKTTIDHSAQEKLQEAVDNNLNFSTKKQKDGDYLVQGAATAIDNQTGKVVAIVGGRTQESKGRTLNRAFQSYNQPGSTFKPLIVYTPAFERGYEPDTIVNDRKFDGGPANSDSQYKGLIKLSQAVIESRNTVAWQILDDIGPKTGLRYVQDMNFSHIVPDDYYDAAALGGLTYGVNTVEMASGYSTLAQGGVYRKATCIDSIEDSDGNQVFKETMPKRIYKQFAAKEMTDILQDVIKKGTGRGLSLKRGMPSAGKTGTTNNQRSGWFCGFSPYYSISTWVGTDNNEEVENLWGGTYPGNIWKDAMNALCENKKVISLDTVLNHSDLLEKSGDKSKPTTTEKKVATTATTEIDESADDDVVASLNDLIYDYENLEIQNDDDLAKVTSLQNEIEQLLKKLKTKDNQKFYQSVYEQAKSEIQQKVMQYKRNTSTTSTQEDTSTSVSTEETDISMSSQTTTETESSDNDENNEFGWQN